MILLTLFSCCTPKAEKSTGTQNILSVDKTAEIMAHIHLHEAVLQHNNTLTPEKKIIAPTDIFKELNSSREDYENSVRFYSQNPTELKQIHELAMEKINKMKKERINK